MPEYVIAFARIAAAMQPRLITPGFVADLLECPSRAGLDPGPFLQGMVWQHGLEAPDYGRLWWRIAQGMQDEFLGLGARPMRPGAFALMCHAALDAGRLDRALTRILRFLAVVLDHPQGALRPRGALAEIVLTDPTPRPAFAQRTFWLIVTGLACWLTGRRIPLRSLDFSGSAPEGRPDYLQFFGTPVRFGSPMPRLALEAAHLRLPLVRDKAALRVFLREAPGNLLLRHRQEQGVAAQARARLTATPPSDWPDFETLAAELDLSPATLRRQLRADGQSYGAMKDELRAARAQRLLRKGDLSVAEIAAALGYSEPSAFHRAFVKWTGHSPGALRRRG